MTAADTFPARAPTRPTWLVTLADLALLLVGFVMLVQAIGRDDPARLAAALHAGFGDPDLPVAAAAQTGFAPGAATAPLPADLSRWAFDAARDPRVVLTLTGEAGATPADIDAVTGSAALLAADRARGLAAQLIAAGLPPRRLAITTRTGRPAVTVTAAFAGEPPRGR